METMRAFIGLGLFLSHLGIADTQFLSASDGQVIEGIFGRNARFVSVLSPGASNDSTVKDKHTPFDTNRQTKPEIKYHDVKIALPEKPRGVASVYAKLQTQPDANNLPVLRESHRKAVKIQRIRPVKDNETSRQMHDDDVTDKQAVQPRKYVHRAHFADLINRFESTSQLQTTQTVNSDKKHVQDFAKIQRILSAIYNETPRQMQEDITGKSSVKPRNSVLSGQHLASPTMASNYNINLTNRFEQPITQTTNSDKEHFSGNPKIKQPSDENSVSAGSSFPQDRLVDYSGSNVLLRDMFRMLATLLSEKQRHRDVNMFDAHKDQSHTISDQLLQPMKLMDERKMTPKYGFPGIVNMIPMVTKSSDNLSPVILVLMRNYGNGTKHELTSINTADTGKTSAKESVHVQSITSGATDNTGSVIKNVQSTDSQKPDNFSGEEKQLKLQESSRPKTLVTRGETSETVGNTAQLGNKAEQTNVSTEQIHHTESAEGTMVYVRTKPYQGEAHVKPVARDRVEAIAGLNNTDMDLIGVNSQVAVTSAPSTTIIPILVLNRDYGRYSYNINSKQDKQMPLREGRQQKTSATRLLKSSNSYYLRNSNIEGENIATQVVERTLSAPGVAMMFQTQHSKQYDNNVDERNVAMEQVRKFEATEPQLPNYAERRLPVPYVGQYKEQQQLPSVVLRRLPGPNAANVKRIVRDHVNVITRTPGHKDTDKSDQIEQNKPQRKFPSVFVRRLPSPKVAHYRPHVREHVTVITRSPEYKQPYLSELIKQNKGRLQIPSVNVHRLSAQNIAQNRPTVRDQVNVVTRNSITKPNRLKHPDTFKSNRLLIDRRPNPVTEVKVIAKDRTEYVSVSKGNNYPRVGEGFNVRQVSPRSDKHYTPRNTNLSRRQGGKGSSQTSKPIVLVLDNNTWIPHQTYKMLVRRRMNSREKALYENKQEMLGYDH